MRNTKYRFETLRLYDYRGVEEHLSALAAQGWRLEKVGHSFWKYRRAEPAKVRYAVTYSAGASRFNPGPTDDQKSLAELCEAAGWQKVCDWLQMQIFCTEDEAAVPLETDEALRLENIHRSMQKNFLPTNIALLIFSLLLSALFLYTLFTDPVRLFENDDWPICGVLFLLLALLEIHTLFHYYLWRRRSRQSVEEGGPCAPIDTRRCQRLDRGALYLTWGLAVIYLLTLFLSGDRRLIAFFLLHMVLLGLLAFAVQQTTAFLRGQGYSKWDNIVGTLVVDVVLAVVMVGGLSWAVLHFDGFSGGSDETYEYMGWIWDVSPEEGFPLTVSDLTGREYKHISRLHYDQGSFFLPESHYLETVLQEGGQTADIHYTIWEPRFSWLRDALVEDLIKETDLAHLSRKRRYVPEDPAPWGAEAAYLQYFDSQPSDVWLLVWPGRAVLLVPDHVPTTREKAAIGALLAPEA